MNYGGIFDFDKKINRLNEINTILEHPDSWEDATFTKVLGPERKQLEALVSKMELISKSIIETHALFELGKAENDDDLIIASENDLLEISKTIENLEFFRMFSHPADPNNCFIDIQAGAGGTEACDWANMLLRQYLRYCETKNFICDILEKSEGDVAGIKSASIKVTGQYAYGYLRTESGVHRLVRKSPFDSSGGRHTSFASLFVYPEITEEIEVEINPADLRIDTYRASGAGGQHINKTDSAVRITHLPSGIVVQCQNDRSQHRNRASALAMLKSRLYEQEQQKRIKEKDKLEASKTDVGWGNQIRSYVLDQSRIKDLRTGYEVSNTKSVLDGELDEFIIASLKQGK